MKVFAKTKVYSITLQLYESAAKTNIMYKNVW